MRARLSSVLLLAAVLAACDTGEPGSLYDPGAEDGPAPVIASVAPDGVVLAGIDVVTITGQNFSATPEHNTVYFDDGAGAVQRGTVVEATETTLRVRVPNLPNPNLKVRVAVRGAQGFSNAVARPLTAAFVPFGDLAAGVREEAIGIASDDTGALYASLIQLGSSLGIQRFSLNGERSYFSTDSSATYPGLVFHNGALYGARRVRALFRLPGGGAEQSAAVLSRGVSLSVLASSPGRAIWAGGAGNANLYRIADDGTVSAFPFAEEVRALAVHDGALYVASMNAGASVWRFPIGASGALGAGSVFFSVSDALGPATEVFALAVAADGTVFVGTDAEDPVLEVTPDGTGRALYPGVLSPPASAFAWGPGSKLYMAQASVAPASPDAPVTPGRLLLLETRREGP